MKKRLIVLLSVLLFAFLLVACQNEPAETEDDVDTLPVYEGLDFYALSDESLGVKANKDFVLQDLVIPSTYDGKAVTELADEAFKDCKSLKTVKIPDSVKHIGVNAFVGCDALECMTLPFVGAEMDGREHAYLGYLFGSNSKYDNNRFVPASLTEVVVTGGTTLADYAFSNCENLKSITIADSVSSIGRYVMQGCNNLERLTLPFIGENKDGTSSRRFSYVFGDPIPIDGNNSRGDDESVPKSLKKVMITGGKAIYSNAFYKCHNLTHVTFGKDVETLEFFALRGLKKLESVSFTEDCKIMKIGNSAFMECTALVSIEIPDSVTKLGNNVFEGCSQLKRVAIGEGLTSVPSYAFKDCTELTKVELGNKVTKIEKGAFSNCHVLQEIKLYDSLTMIEQYAFENCRCLKSITLPKGVTHILDGAFIGCESLESVVIPDSVIFLGMKPIATGLATRIYYGSTAEQWSKVDFEWGFPTSFVLYYYSESEPTETGNFWHYVNGVPTAW